MQENSVNRARIELHPTARSRAVAVDNIPEGSIVTVASALATVLILSEKGHRCDFCFRVATEERKLRKCTGCAAQWYCSTQCQAQQWKAHHKKICKIYPRYTSSNTFQSLQTHEKLDALLLAHVLAQESTSEASLQKGESSLMSTFLSLLPGPDMTNEFKLPLPDLQPMASVETAQSLYSRFGNNNFAIHTHLNTVGNGIFPLASRLYNHSCYPNAATRYLFTSTGVIMEVVALRHIQQGEEICIPYLDPAMLQTRQQIFELTYGFRCTCSSCVDLKGLGDILPPPSDPDELLPVAKLLRTFLGLDKPFTALPEKPRGTIPRLLHCVFHETYISTVSETFSESSHGSQYELAMESGITLLGAYILIYPRNYPQIGMHLLELAKTAWNMFVSCEGTDRGAAQTANERAWAFLSMSREILMVFGLEGDAGGPLSEVTALQSLLES